MSTIQRKVVQSTDSTWKFWCPGCDGAHVVSNLWRVDTDTDTITPSILVWPSKYFIDSHLTGDALLAPENIGEHHRCHSFVTNGRIEFLGDSTHALAGQTVDVPEWIAPADEYRGQ